MLPAINIPQLYTCDATKLVREFLSLARGSDPSPVKVPASSEEIKLIKDEQFRRLGATVDMELALRIYNTYRYLIVLYEKFRFFCDLAVYFLH